MKNETPSDERLKCQRCSIAITRNDALAIGKTFVIFYYCANCFEVVVNEEN